MNRKTLALSMLASLSFSFAFGSRYEMVEPPHRSRYEIVPTVSDPLSRVIKINVRDIEFSILFSLLSEQAGIPIVFKDISQGDLKKVSYFSQGKTLRQILDELTSVQDLFWEYREGKIEIFKYKAETFKINLPLLKKNVNISRDELTATYQKDFWGNLESSLRQLLKDANSKLAVNDMGYVFVWARPSELILIRQAIERINRDYTKTIPLRVSVFIVRDEDLRQVGFSFNFSEGSVSGGLQNNVGLPLFSLSVLTSRLEAGLNLLSASGKLKVLDESVIIALNGQPVYYAPQTTTRIVSGYEVVYVAAGGGIGVPSAAVPSVRVRTEDINQGTLLILVPYYISENRIVIDVYREDNRLERLEKQQVSLPNTQGSNLITLPETTRRRTLSQTVLERGERMLLVSSALTIEQMREQGIPFLKDIPLLGIFFGSKEKSRDLYRVLITIGFDEGGAKNDTVR